MTEQAARLTGPCEGCGRPGAGWAAQLVRGGRLRWETEWACDACGIAHDGGRGPSPALVREAIVERHGLHCLRPGDDEVRGAHVLKYAAESEDGVWSVRDTAAARLWLELHPADPGI
jgi:hypothetical protein